MGNVIKSMDNVIEESEHRKYEDMDQKQRKRLERLSYLSLAYAIEGEEKDSERVLSILRKEYGHQREIKR